MSAPSKWFPLSKLHSRTRLVLAFLFPLPATALQSMTDGSARSLGTPQVV